MLAEQLSIIVNRQPESIAIEDAHRGSITYRELWQYLQATSAVLDDRLGKKMYVAGIADQDAFAIIAYIATMLTGRVIIPLDPRHDSSLVEKVLAPFTSVILSDTCIKVGSTFTTVLFDEIVTKSPTSYTFSSSNQDAYILHTSGTTGQPKPVLADQSALLRVATALAEKYHITPESKVLQFAYLSFDSSLIEIWSTLLAGGTIVIAGQPLRDDLYGCLENLLQGKSITVATLPSSVASSIEPRHFTALSTLILAGDECPVELANSLYPHIPHLINAYGPTESIICASTFEITTLQSGRIPIGTPLPGMEIIIDNPDDSGAGEMILVSSYLAKGYAHNQELADKKFGVYGSHQSYRSGDIGRLTDGAVYEFLGRIDNQVKINGQRIEIEGVETRIRSATKNTAVAVISYNEKLYCIYQASATLGVFTNLETTLAGSLPDYAVPRVCIPIKTMPLDLNGKISRRSLKEFVVHSLQYQVSDTPSAGTDMVGLWSKVLNIPESAIQPNTNFFTIGGDSLDALRLVKAINTQYQSSVKLMDIIKNPATPESMANIVNGTVQ